MQDIVISIKDLSKRYWIKGSSQLAAVGHSSSKDLVALNEFWALKQVNLNIKRGEVVGLIGKNGAGKSTLLKVLSGITKPTTGTITLKGTVCSMLEVGTGFNPDLTGRENVFMNGLLLGMTKKAIAQRLEAIIDYSGVGKFIDTQVKHYSSGMYVRLAFSILAKLETNILLLDEVLSVGDADFKIKSFDTLHQLAQSGKTIILASHNAQELAALCSRVIWLEDSTVRYDGTTGKTIEQYLLATYEGQDIYSNTVQQDDIKQAEEAIDEDVAPKEADAAAVSVAAEDNMLPQKDNIDLVEKIKLKVWDDDTTAPGNDKLRLLKVGVRAVGKNYDEPVFMEDEIEFEVVFNKLNDEKTTDVTLEVFSITGVHVFVDSMTLRYREFNHNMPSGVYTLQAKIPGRLLNQGVYFITLAAAINMRQMIEVFQRILYFRVVQNKDLVTTPAMQDIYDMNEFIACVVKPELQWQLFDNNKHRIL